MLSKCKKKETVFPNPNNNFVLSHYLTFKPLKPIGQYTVCTYCNMKLNDFGSKLREQVFLFEMSASLLEACLIQVT